jgi:hypothetical protein
LPIRALDDGQVELRDAVGGREGGRRLQIGLGGMRVMLVIGNDAGEGQDARRDQPLFGLGDIAVRRIQRSLRTVVPRTPAR